MRRIVRIAAGVAAAVALTAFATSCDDDPISPQPPTFTATLLGANERPNPVTTSATGTATFTDNTTSIDYKVDVANLTAPFASHIHLGGAAVAGPVIFNLFNPVGTVPGSFTGTLAAGTIRSTSSATISLDSLRTLFNNGNAYVNVHTTANGGGEIRGQIARSN